jgi:hypothetical protein
MRKRTTLATLALLLSTASFAGATGAGNRPFSRGTCGRGLYSLFAVREAVGLTADQKLICFNAGIPSISREIGGVSGLSVDTRLVGIDVRPATGDLYGLGDLGGVYVIDLDRASATLASRLNVALDGTSFGIDFNPTVDRLRIVSDAGQNLRANVDTGATTEDLDLMYAAPALGVTGAAYTNNDANADTATTLYDIDSTLDQVVIQAPPNNGSLNPTGKLLVDTSAEIGFDIYSTVRNGGTTDNIAYASLNSGGLARFYRVNLFTGRASLLGTFRAGVQVIDIALPLNQF